MTRKVGTTKWNILPILLSVNGKFVENLGGTFGELVENSLQAWRFRLKLLPAGFGTKKREYREKHCRIYSCLPNKETGILTGVNMEYPHGVMISIRSPGSLLPILSLSRTHCIPCWALVSHRHRRYHPREIPRLLVRDSGGWTRVKAALF